MVICLASATYAYLNEITLPNRLSSKFYDFLNSEGIPVNVCCRFQLPGAAIENEKVYSVPRGYVAFLKGFSGTHTAAAAQNLRFFDSPTNTYSAANVKFTGTLLQGDGTAPITQYTFQNPIPFNYYIWTYSGTDGAINISYNFNCDIVLLDMELYSSWLAKHGRDIRGN